MSATPARRLLRAFVGAIALVHGVAIALYYALGIPHAPAPRQRIFAWVWMGATVVVVFAGLQRIKRARRPGSKPDRNRS